MTEFVYLYRGNDISASPEEMQKTTAKWIEWLKDLNDKGYLKDFGQPLLPEGRVVKGAGKTIVDGPYAEAKDIVGGYSLIVAESIEKAVELAMECPIFAVGGSVEVRPVRQLG